MERLPEQVRVGMKVYDSEGHHIGKIDDLKSPENTIVPEVEVAEVDDVIDDRDETIIDAVAEAFGREEIPEPLQHVVDVERRDPHQPGSRPAQAATSRAMVARCPAAVNPDTALRGLRS